MAILTVTKDDIRIELPAPKSLSWSVKEKSGSGSGTNQNGDTFKDIVSEKRTLTVNWAPLSQQDSETILNAIEDTFYTIEYPDPKLGSASMVVGNADVTLPMYSYINENAVWGGLKVKFEER